MSAYNPNRGGRGDRGGRRGADLRKEGPEVNKYQSLIKCLPLSAQFVSEGLQAVPDYPSPSVSVSFDILGNDMSKNISLKAALKVPGLKKRHTADLDFYPGLEDSLLDLSFQRETESDAHDEIDTPGFIIKWKTRGGVGCGIKIDQDSLDFQSRRCLDLMDRFSSNSEISAAAQASSHYVSIRVITLGVTKEDLGKLESLLQALRATTNAKPPWFAYLDENGRPNCDFASMPDVDAIKIAHHGWTQFPAKDFFVGPEEAHIRLGYGSKQEYEHDVDKVEQRKQQILERRRQERSRTPRNGQAEQDEDEEEVHLRPVPDRIVRRQLLALTRLCDRSRNVLGRRFWPVLLNRETSQLDTFDPTACVGLDEEEVKNAMQTVKYAFNWTDEQDEAIDMATSLRGRLGLLRGPPGSGKTQVLVGITAFYVLIGIDVILFTPSAPAAENLCKTLREFLKALRRPSDNEPVRVNPIGLYHKSPDYHRLRRRSETGQHDDGIDFSDAEVVISTLDNGCIDSLFDEFGSYSEGIMIIHDDANMEVESDTWMTIFGLEERGKVQGIILAGDASEWHTDMHSRNSHMNAFAAQMSLSLFDRLFHRDFPTASLKQQHRMRPQLSRLPILRQYKTHLINAPETTHREVSAQFVSFLRSWLGAHERKTDADLAVTLVNVSRGHGEKDRSKSKRNFENVAVVMDFCVKNYETNGLDPSEIVILSPYRGQVDLYNKVISMEQEKHELPDEAFPTPCTVDGFRGKESKVVILDLVLSDSSDRFELGMVSDEYRSILGSTRARDFLIIVVNMTFNMGVMVNDADYNFMRRHLEHFDFSDDEQKRDPSMPKPVPFFNNYADILRGEGKIYEKNVAVDPNYVKEFKEGPRRGQHSTGTWERQDWQSAGVVSGQEYANPQHERDERSRVVAPFDGSDSQSRGRRARR
jgi:hypothetical protein